MSRSLALGLSMALVLVVLAPVHEPGGRAEAQTQAACPANAVVRVSAPSSDAPSTVTAEVDPNVSIKQASDGDAQSFHLHYYVNTDPARTLKVGDVIPSGDPQIIHSGSKKVDLKLPSGPHTVWVVLGQLGHQACGSSDGRLTMGAVQFTVPAGQGANEQAVAEDDDGDNAWIIAVALVLLAAAAIAALAYSRGAFGTPRRLGRGGRDRTY